MPDTAQRLRELYNEDEAAWLAEMVRLLAEGNRDDLDFDHLAEYLAHRGFRDRLEVTNRLTSLATQLLKWDQQPDRRSNSRRRTIAEQRLELFDLLESHSLRDHAAEALPNAVRRAVGLAAIETGLPAETFAGAAELGLDDLLSRPLEP